MLTEKDYCDYETCVALKGLGFNALVDWYFNEDKSIVSSLARYRNTYIPRISLYEAQKWLRKEKQIGVFVSGFKNGYTFWVNNLLSGDTLYQGFFDNQTGKKYKSYEEALLEGIKEAVKILKEE